MYYIYLIKYFINATIVACFDFSAKYTEPGFLSVESIEIGQSVDYVLFTYSAEGRESLVRSTSTGL